ncbi:chromosome segregation protein SMC [Velocimicrobium porci]|uniref:Chromosome partition protein Smc n=1 Tax=Velocimicrobium porci TaxID=2606634 RepID=A0A6L5XZL3_9FIRM|nr:chromosome segregation protein SMC [Velocimicrobium porci]MSS63363.1 chromosome segregation protein SMC [Velocimicrobium porci]
MYLKSIEVQGFKSFANKLTFEFHDGITAIVGPNGSGKSNVADAVRWVLGEQSAKQLRGSKMEDVIFSGTETRKPQSYAYVAITLDNSDHKLATSYEEVTVARRVYRSGESEYLMNGSNCRLKDVQELFLDTGIGKEGYSIIGQGQIDKILSGKPEDRRELFDEAAGIVKFKKRKATAEKNLDSERQNLCRINDILSEIETQVGPLEQQSKVAKEYLALKEELKTLDVSMFLMEYDKNHDELKAVNEKLKIAEQQLGEKKATYESTKDEYEKLEKSLEEKNVRLEEHTTLQNESRLQKEKLEGDIKVLREQIIATRQNRTHYKERVASSEQFLTAKRNELKELEKKKFDLQEESDRITKEQKKAEKELQEILSRMEAYTEELESYNKARYQALHEDTDVKTNLQKYQTMLEQVNIKKAELVKRILKNKSDEAGFDEEILNERKKLEELSEKLQLFEQEKKEKLRDVSKVESQILSKRKEESQFSQEYMREKSRLESLKNMTERYDGYGQSIRRVMEQKDHKPGIVGVVADIIKVPKEYEVAIEIALGGSIQNIVTEDENTAKSLIQFLKQNKYGRATFLPLTAISGRGGFLHREALKETGVVGVASELVKAEQRFASLLEYLLGRVLIVDHIDHAISIAKKYKQSIRIVTLEGEQINPGGAMSGGAFKNSSNLLGRRREMEDMEKQILSHETSLVEIRKNIENESERKQKLEKDIEQLKETIQTISLEQYSAKMKYQQAKKQKEENESILHTIQSDSIQIEKQITELKSHIFSLSKELEEKSSKDKELEEKASKLGNQLEQAKQEEINKRNEVEKIRLSQSSAGQQNQFLLENQIRIQEEIRQKEQELEELKTGMAEGEKQVKEKEDAIVSVKNRILECEKELEEMEQAILSIRQEKELIEKNHKGFFAKREELSEHMNDLDKECFRLTSQKEKISEQIENQMNYMWEEYELTYNSARELYVKTEETLSSIKKSIGELKVKIRRLGDVNVNAIEDYRNLSERYTLLGTQRDDLIEAEEALLGIIKELDEEMRKQFSSKFKDIQIQFDKVFKELFGGGKGTLELMEEEDILEAGIRIIAQPPGKKLQNMMQLSGGEKALTAISLLFAIQNLKPSPFCLLDEIEAALDDSNVGRYAQYLHKLTKDTQFIVITHRRGTMAAADILYGITMQEKGVSTLVSVSLLEEELEK